MTAALATAPRDVGLFDRPAEATLDELVVESWESLASGRPIVCPVCDGDMAPRHRPGTGELAGECAHCGAGLS